MKYSPNLYWNELLDRFDSSAVSHPTLSNSFNKWIYRSRVNAFKNSLKKINFSKGLKELNVLDIGSGTGFWLKQLSLAGFVKIHGLDLTKSSINSLKKIFPNLTLKQGDITSLELKSKLPGKYDLITVMDVLLHVTDEIKFERALQNIGNFLNVGGYLLIIEPVVTRNGYLNYKDGDHSKTRKLTRYQELMKKSGIKIISINPVSFFLNNPVESGNLLEFNIFHKTWLVVSKLDSKINFRGEILGAILYLIDKCASKILKHGPSSKIIIAKKVRS